MSHYLTAQQLLFIHARLIATTGGEHGVLELEQFTFHVVNDHPPLEEIAAWFEKNAQPSR